MRSVVGYWSGSRAGAVPAQTVIEYLLDMCKSGSSDTVTEDWTRRSEHFYHLQVHVKCLERVLVCS